jgi:predicted RNA binding protein YcfA (HicA-like mRNA interferase family)
MDSKTLIKQLQEKGWQEVSRSGSHRTYKHPEVPELVTVKHPQKDIPIGTLRSTQRIAGLK